MDKNIVIGTIVAPHGVRGEFRIKPQTECPEQFQTLEHLFLEDGRELHLISAREHKNVILVQAEEVTSMDEAELLRGQKVLVPRSELPPLPAERYYVSDLLGMQVVDLAGKNIGSLVRVFPAGSTDVFVVKQTNGEEVMVVAIADNIKEINMAERTIKVVLPEWAD